MIEFFRLKSSFGRLKTFFFPWSLKDHAYETSSNLALYTYLIAVLRPMALLKIEKERRLI